MSIPPWRCADNSIVLLMTFPQFVLSSEGSRLSAGNPLRSSVCDGGLFSGADQTALAVGLLSSLKQVWEGIRQGIMRIGDPSLHCVGPAPDKAIQRCGGASQSFLCPRPGPQLHGCGSPSSLQILPHAAESLLCVKYRSTNLTCAEHCEL